MLSCTAICDKFASMTLQILCMIVFYYIDFNHIPSNGQLSCLQDLTQMVWWFFVRFLLLETFSAKTCTCLSLFSLDGIV